MMMMMMILFLKHFSMSDMLNCAEQYTSKMKKKAQVHTLTQEQNKCFPITMLRSLKHSIIC